MALGENAKKVWQTWDVRGFILISLFIQFFLLFCAPFRKRTKNWVVHRSIWLAYLAADWVAAFVVGLILHGPVSPSIDTDLLVYWTPFLLVHLGGPDTITAFSFEDNELWARHLLQFLVQVATTGYLFYQSLHSNKLLAPTLLIYLAGIIKYGERIRSLYLASLSTFRETLVKGEDLIKGLGDVPGEKDEPTDHTLNIEKAAMLRIETNRSADTSFRGCSDLHERLVTDSFCLFKFFQKTLFDSNFTTDERDKIRTYFLNIKSAGEAFRIMEIELNLFYEVLYTKIIAFNQRLGYCLRFVSFSAILVSLVLWHDTVDKSGYSHKKIDVKITYTLVIGALAMDIIACIGLALSDYMIGYLGLHIYYMDDSTTRNSYSIIIIKKAKCLALKTVLLLKSITWSAYNNSSTTGTGQEEEREDKGIIICDLPQRILGMLFYRWSRTIPGPQPPLYRICETAVYSLIRRTNYFKSQGPWSWRFSNDLMDFIFDQVRKEVARDNPQCSSGGLGLIHAACRISLNGGVETLDYSESMLLWIVTTISLLDSHNVNVNNVHSHNVNVNNVHIEHCRVLSHYMLYLIRDHPVMMSTGVSKGRFLQTYKKLSDWYLQVHRSSISDLTEALEADLDEKEEQKWEIISKKLVELLCYAAIECRPRDLIEQVSRGGELITFVWSLITHFGLAKHYSEPAE